MGLYDALRITQQDIETKGVTAAPNILQGTAQENKRLFDRLIREVVAGQFNALLEQLDLLGVENIVRRVESGEIRYIRLNEDNVLEVSADGETWGATGSSGHIIEDADGAVLPQRSRMRFANGSVEDVDGVTIVSAMKGDKGDTGDVGPQGPQGVQGIQGPQGYVLVPSIDDDGVISWSIQTPSGTVPASRNIRGPQGVQGVQGVQGATGATGPQGPQGIQGVQGPQGQRGNDGADGRSFTILGLYASLAEFLAEHPTGEVGDAWAIGTAANNTIYNWDTEQETWVDIGSLQGPPGPRGEQGEQGVQGATGATGPQGVQGPAGPQGVQGIQGPEGPEGPRGFPAIVNGVTPDAGGNIELEPSDIGAQPTINVSGILKGDGAGGVSAATLGLDYQAPLTAGDNIEITSDVIRTKAFPCNPNLLDNWYFGNPVNQRGATTFASEVYGIDRWFAYGGTCTFDNVNKCIIVPNTSTQLVQKIEDSLIDELNGKKVTLSMLLLNGVLVSGTSTLDSAWSNWFFNDESYGGQFYSGGSGNYNVHVVGENISIKALKLELGSQQTLAHQENGVWVLNEIPDYGEQLRRCQRYYYHGDRIAVTQAGGGTVVSFPAQMRTTPAVTVSAGTASYVSRNEVIITGLAANTVVPFNMSATADL